MWLQRAREDQTEVGRPVDCVDNSTLSGMPVRALCPVISGTILNGRNLGEAAVGVTERSRQLRAFALVVRRAWRCGRDPGFILMPRE